MKKILIISGVPFYTDTNLGKTLKALFQHFSKEELSQLYFSPYYPNISSCSSYYRITEKQIIHSFFGLNKKNCGGEVKEHSEYVLQEKNPSVFVKYKNTTILLVLRELLWKIGRWNNDNLKKWLDRTKPDVIFYVMTNSYIKTDFVQKLAVRLNCPVILFVTDDYYNDTKKHSSVFRRKFFYRLQKSIDSLGENVVSTVVGCSKIAAEEFGAKFHKKFYPLFTPTSKEGIVLKDRIWDGKTVIFRYFGNLDLDRWKVLSKLGKEIAKYNNKKGKKTFLEIYAPIPSKKILTALNIFNGSCYMGWVQGENYWKLLEYTDVAIHVESFSDEICRQTRLSISTKIADYLGAGKCILAIGDASLASIQHLQNSAYIVNNPENIFEAVCELSENACLRYFYQKKAREQAKIYHDPIKITREFRNIFE